MPHRSYMTNGLFYKQWKRVTEAVPLKLDAVVTQDTVEPKLCAFCHKIEFKNVLFETFCPQLRENASYRF